MPLAARPDLGTVFRSLPASCGRRPCPYPRLPVPIRASRSATLPSRPSAPARPAPWETVLGLLKKARAVFHGAAGRAALPPSASRPPVRQDGLARLDAHPSFLDLISQQRGRVAPVAEISEPSGERPALGNPSARRALSASGVRRRRQKTPPTRSRFPIGDRFPCSALPPFASRPSRGRPLPGRASGRGARNRRHGKPHGAYGKPLTRFPTTAAVRARRS